MATTDTTATTDLEARFNRETHLLAGCIKVPAAIAHARDEIGRGEMFASDWGAQFWQLLLNQIDDNKPINETTLRAAIGDDYPLTQKLDDALKVAATFTTADASIKQAVRRRAKQMREDYEAQAAPAPKEAKPGETIREPMITRLSDVQTEAVSWLWPSRLALGKLSLLVGDPAMGKSFLTCDLAATVTTGSAWPDGSGNAPRGGVVICNAEDGLADTIKPRLEAAHADCSSVVALEGSRTRDDKGREIEAGFCLADLEPLELAIQAVPDCKLVVIDPISAYMGSTDSHVNSEVRSLLKPLGDLAAKYRVAVVLVSHLNKSAAQAMYRTTGSLAFIAAARAAWCCVADKDDPARRMMLSLKNNLAPDVGGLAYTITDGRVQWLGAVTVNVNDAMAQARDTEDEGGALGEAKEFLRDALANGPLDANEVRRLAQESCVATRTLWRAKAELKIKPIKAGSGPWKWALPATMPKDASTKSMAPLAALAALPREKGNGDDWERTKIDPAEFKHVWKGRA